MPRRNPTHTPPVGLRCANPTYQLGLILARPQASADQARGLIAGAGSERPWLLDWIETILVYKFPQLSREEIRMLLDLKDPELRQTRFFQEVFAEGQDEGRHGEALAMVLRQLRRRLGPLSGETEERLAALSLSRLEDLGEDLLDFARPADLTDWLRRCE